MSVLGPTPTPVRLGPPANPETIETNTRSCGNREEKPADYRADTAAKGALFRAFQRIGGRRGRKDRVSMPESNELATKDAVTAPLDGDLAASLLDLALSKRPVLLTVT